MKARKGVNRIMVAGRKKEKLRERKERKEKQKGERGEEGEMGAKREKEENQVRVLPFFLSFCIDTCFLSFLKLFILCWSIVD